MFPVRRSYAIIRIRLTFLESFRLVSFALGLHGVVILLFWHCEVSEIAICARLKSRLSMYFPGISVEGQKQEINNRYWACEQLL